MPYKDPQKRKEYHSKYFKEWVKLNLKKARETGRKAMEKWRAENPELSAAKLREWRRNNKKKSLEQVNKYKANNPEKAIAHRLVLMAKKAGEIIQLPCEVCGNKRSQAHHDDYSKPLVIIWLCQKHHSAKHRELKAAGHE